MSARKPDGSIDPSKLIPPDIMPASESRKSVVDFNAVTIDQKVSCNIDDAVAKMLGWLSAPTSLVNILIDGKGITEDKLIALDTLVYPLEDHLLELLELAQDRANIVFADESSTQEAKDKAISDIEKCEQQINKAKHYKLAINEELSKDDLSELEIDKTESENSGETYIKIISLDRWARKHYRFSVLENAHGPDSKKPELQSPLVNGVAKSSTKILKEPQRSDALRVEIIEIINSLPNPTPAHVMNALRKKIGSESTCILGNDDQGLIWVDENGKKHTIKIKALGERIRNLLNPR